MYKYVSLCSRIVSGREYRPDCTDVYEVPVLVLVNQN